MWKRVHKPNSSAKKKKKKRSMSETLSPQTNFFNSLKTTWLSFLIT
jgi:hypothetical protein